MRKIAILLLHLVFALPGMAADPRSSPEASAQAIAPFVYGQTIALVHLDLTRADADPLLVKLFNLANQGGERAERLSQIIPQWIADVKKAGGKDIYFLADLKDLPRHLSVIVPIENGANASGLQELLSSTRLTELTPYLPVPLGIETTERVGQAIFAGSKAALARLRSSKPDPRPELANAFAAAGDGFAQLLVVPGADVRRVVEEILPNLPSQVGGGPITTLTRGCLWADLGMNGPPRESLQIVIQSKDAAAANSFAALLGVASQALSRDNRIHRILPAIDKLLGQLAPVVRDDRLTITLDLNDPETARLVTGLETIMMQPIRRNLCAQNLTTIALALHSYSDVHKHFPAQANFNAAGKPLLSWRVHILPYLGEEKLYKEFHLDEPWDSEHNKTLIVRMPAVYRCPSMRGSARNKTSYLAPVHESAIFTGGPQGVPIKDIQDGTSNTILLVDVRDEQAVVWTKPEDLNVDLNNPHKGLVGHHDGLIAVLFADGAVLFLPETIEDPTLRALFTRKGGEVVTVPQ